MADLSHAEPQYANLDEARLMLADMGGTDLRDTKNLLLDSTIVRNARFGHDAHDRWREIGGLPIDQPLDLLQ